MKIEILADAREDLLLGYHFFARQSVELGDYFLDSVFSDIDSLYLYAGIHVEYAGYHRLLAKRFPFAIYYKLNQDVVQIYAILDCRRDPLSAKDRLL